MKTLLAHEWLAPIGGSENVYEELMNTFPDANLLCLWNDAPDRFPSALVQETWLSRTPLRRSKALALPFASRAWRSVDLTGIDRVVASTHSFAHHLAASGARSGIPSFAYVHSPARYIWAPDHDARGQTMLARAGRRHFQRLDRRRTSQDVSYAANSAFVARRMSAAWGVDSQVIYPSVAVEHIQNKDDWAAEIEDGREIEMLESLPDSFVLGASRLVEYKRLEAAIEAGESVGLPVYIIGTGPDEPRLRQIASMASVPVHFLGRVSTEALYALYQRTSLFVFMAVEDFGIMPVEAMAAGAPVLVNAEGGARESVELAQGGLAVPTSDVRSAADVAMRSRASDAGERSRYFGVSQFRTNVLEWVGGA